MDGERSVIRAINKIWPHTKIQRCLCHIQREGMRWLRTYPKTQAGRDLRRLLKTLCRISSFKERNEFIASYVAWLNQYREFVLSLPRKEVAFKDLKKTMALIYNALPDMFHFIKDQKIASTSNLLESYFSKLKHQYRCHNGLTETHKIAYLKWFCYLKNNAN